MPNIFSIESVNYTLKAIGLHHVEISDDPRDDGRITMIFHIQNMLGAEYRVLCPTDCMDAREWLERFTNGGWSSIIPRPHARNHPRRRKQQLENRLNG